MDLQPIVVAALAAFAVLQLGDWLTTRAILKRGGRELNPIVRRLMALAGGVDGGLALKTALALVSGGGLAWATTRPDLAPTGLALAALGGLTAWYGLIVGRNWRVLRGMQGKSKRLPLALIGTVIIGGLVATVALAQGAPASFSAPFSAPVAIPRNPAELAAEQRALIRLRPIALRALKEPVAWRWPYLAPGGDPDRVQDYGGDYAVDKLAEATLYKVPAMAALCREVAAPAASATGSATAAEITAAEARGFARAVAAMDARLKDLKP